MRRAGVVRASAPQGSLRVVWSVSSCHKVCVVAVEYDTHSRRLVMCVRMRAADHVTDVW